MEIKIIKNKSPKAMPPENELGFGRYFTDHMFVMNYEEGKGWFDHRIVPFENISIHPASTVLHYGAEIFEGLKAYRTEDGTVQFFRPIENARRMNSSADRMCLPLIPEEDFMQILTTFVDLERDWVPHSFGTSLYLRPFMFGNDESLGVHTVQHATFMLIASPSGSYYAEGINPVKIMIEDEDVRAVKGGKKRSPFWKGAPFLLRVLSEADLDDDLFDVGGGPVGGKARLVDVVREKEPPLAGSQDRAGLSAMVAKEGDVAGGVVCIALPGL